MEANALLRLKCALVALAALCGVALPLDANAASCTNPGKDGPGTPSGIVNTYYACTAGTTVSAGSTSVPLGTLDTSGSTTPIAAGDLVMVMQMQDADIVSSNNSAYGGSSPGTGYSALNNAGVYEYAVVSSTYTTGAATVPLTSSLSNTYRCANYAAGSNGQRRYQLIRVPQYSSASLSGTVTSVPWNGATGGVVAFDVGGQLNWNGGTVDVTGRGFRGGGALWMSGAGAGQTFASTDHAVSLSPLAPTISPNPTTTPSNSGNAFPGAHGSKGEGIAGTPRYLFLSSTAGPTTNAAGSLYDTGVEGYPGGTMGRGAPGNAGGGGSDGNPSSNDQNTGAGGGGSYSSGGAGGYGWTPGTPPGSMTGGFGGGSVPMQPGRMTLGGGGGAATTNNATGNPNYGLASSGASGGGIVLVRAKTIIGTGTLNANGTHANQSVCNDASGGGGGGGSVLVFATDNSGNVGTLTVNVRGGNGGSNTGVGTGNNATACGTCSSNNCPHGPGGGGGGGFAALSSTQTATINVSGGSNGTSASSPTSTPPYGSSSSPGGYQIYTLTSSDIPGASPSPLCYPRLTVTKLTSQPNAVRSGTTSYTITVTNTAGYGTATAATISDVLAAPFTVSTTDGVTLTGGATRTTTVNPSAGATSPSWGTFSIPGGASAAVTFTVAVSSTATAATYQNPATVTYDDPTRSAAGQTITPGGTYNGGGTALGNNYASASSTAEDVTIRLPATVGMSFSPTSINAGGTSTLSITVTNPNGSALTGVGFSDSFPSGLYAVGGAVTVSGTGCTGFTPTTLAANATALSLASGTIPASTTCTFSFSVTAPVLAQYTNTVSAGAVASNEGVTNVAAGSATLLGRPTMVKAFNPVAVDALEDTTLTLAITNPNSGTALSGLSFSDSFTGTLRAVGGAVTVTPAGSCTGFAPTTIAANATAFNLTAGTIAAGATCTLSLTVEATADGESSNTAAGISSTQTPAAGPSSNTARLAVGRISVTKAFSPAIIAPNGSSTVTLTFTNPTGAARNGGTLTDTLTGMTAVGGAVTSTCTTFAPTTLAAGATALTFTGIRVSNPSCSLSFAVTSSTVGTKTNVTSGLTATGVLQGPASNIASLVVAGPPTITQSLSDTTIQQNDATTITFTLVNSGSVTLTAASFTDALNANLKVFGTGTVAAGGTCTGASGNTFTAGTAGASLSFTGLSIPPGAGCTVTLPVTSSTISPAAGYSNVTSGVDSAETGVGSASNSVSIIVVGAPTIAKSFATNPVAPGANTAMTFVLTNPSNVALTGGTFTDTLTNIQVAATGAASGTCTGASGNSFTANQTGTLTFSGLTVPASPATCTVLLNVKSSTSGSNPNTTSGVTTAQTPTAGAASNTANLLVYSPPTMSTAFSPGVIVSGNASTFTITLSNPNTVALTGVAFTDALSNMSVATSGAAGGTCTGASGNSFLSGATSLSFSGLTVPASGSCTVTVSLTSSTVSTGTGHPNTPSGATSTQTPTAGSPPSTSYLGVYGYPTIALAVSTSAIQSGGTATFTYTLTNPNATTLTAVSFTDGYPTNLTTTSVAQSYIGAGRGTCTGAIPSAQVAGTAYTTLTFSGMSIPANSSCTVMVDVTSTTLGVYSNSSTGVTSTQTGTTAGPISNAVTLNVGRVAIAKAFSPTTIGLTEKSTLTFTLTNTSALTQTGNIVFTDTFPSGMTFASPLTATNTCGGTLRNVADTANSAAGDTGLRLKNATLANDSTCTVTVEVTTSAVGSFANTSSGVTYGGPYTGAVSNTATLVVVAKPTVTQAFSPTSLDAYRTSTLTFTLGNAGTSALTSCVLTNTLTGYYVASPATLGGTCTGVTNTPALAAGATALNLTVPTLSVGSCTVTVPVTSNLAGTYSSAPSGLQCAQNVSAGPAPTPTSVTFNKLPLQFTKVANVSNVGPGGTVTYTMAFTNPNAQMAIQSVVISDVLPPYTRFASASCGALPASLTACTISAPAVGAAGTVTWTFTGSLNAGASGTVTLTVTVQ